MATASAHLEEDFLIKMFAYYTPLAQVVILFREQFGHPPTADQIAVTNIGDFIKDKRAVFKDNNRVNEFIRWRRIYDEKINNIAINNPAWRMMQYDLIYNRLKPMAMETGNWGRCLDVLVTAAKDSAGGFGQKKSTIIDNRTVNVNMSNDELNRKLKDFEDVLGVKLSDLALVEHGATVIEGESEK